MEWFHFHRVAVYMSVLNEMSEAGINDWFKLFWGVFPSVVLVYTFISGTILWSFLIDKLMVDSWIKGVLIFSGFFPLLFVKDIVVFSVLLIWPLLLVFQTVPQIIFETVRLFG